jgi:hypothetical protein
MASKDTQFSIAIVERDVNGDDLCVWSFPGVSSELQSICVNRCASEGQLAPEFYFKVKSDWIYVHTKAMPKDVARDVEFFSICLVSKSFNPEKFNLILKLLTEQYLKSGDPTKVLEGYLSIHTTSKYSNDAGSFTESAFKEENVVKFDSNLKELVQKIGVEIVILWNAVLLKKRVLIISDDLISLQQTLRTLPLFIWHRRDFSVLRPVIRNESEHIEDLTSSGVFIAGSLDASLVARSDLFDVIVSLAGGESRVNVAGHAQADMALCAVHKELSGILTELSEDPSTTDRQLLEAVAKKTSTILTQLKSLAGEGEALTVAAINGRVTNKAAQQWLSRVATAEGLM